MKALDCSGSVTLDVVRQMHHLDFGREFTVIVNDREAAPERWPIHDIAIEHWNLQFGQFDFWSPNR